MFILILKNLVFTVVAPGMIGVYLPLLFARGRSSASGLAFVIGILFVAAGASFYLRCMWDFLSFGRATPAPIDAPKKLVVRGFYRYVRNPMYIGVLTMIAGWSILFSAIDLLVYGVIIGAAFHLFVTVYEEPHLRSVFGADYDDYCARVGRWLPRRPSH